MWPCRGVCAGKEAGGAHDERLVAALQTIEVAIWPYEGRVAIEEREGKFRQLHAVDHWNYLGSTGSVKEARRIKALPGQFDRDDYHILARPILANELKWSSSNWRTVSASGKRWADDACMALPPSYRWSDNAEGGAHLYQNYACVAAIKPDGTTKLKGWQREFHSKAASVDQAKRFIERWINARTSPRAYECARWRAKYSKQQAKRDTVRQYRESTSLGGLLGQRSGSPLSSRVIKFDDIPDDFESIAHVGQSLQPFANLSGLNVTANAPHAPVAQRGTGTVAHSRHAPFEQGRRVNTIAPRNKWAYAADPR